MSRRAAIIKIFRKYLDSHSALRLIDDIHNAGFCFIHDDEVRMIPAEKGALDAGEVCLSEFVRLKREVEDMTQRLEKARTLFKEMKADGDRQRGAA